MTSYLGQEGLPRGLKNNNPGNLVLTNINWQGKIPNAQNTDGHFEQFRELRYGIRAMMRDLIHDVNKGLDNLNDLIAEYAPPHENDTANYVSFVSNATGIHPTDKLILNKPILIALVKAKIAMENGSAFSSYVSDKDYQDAIDILGVELLDGAELKKKSLSGSLEQSGSYLHCPSCSAELILQERSKGTRETENPNGAEG